MKNTYKKITNLHQAKKGDHIVLLYKDKNEYISSVIPFIKSSLIRNEKCLYIDEKENLGKIKRELSNRIDNLEVYLEKNQLQLLTKEQSYFINKEFDSDKMISLIKEGTIKALKEGYSGLNMTGELAEVLKLKKGKEEIINYEWKLNHKIFNNLPFTALCRYKINKYDPETIKSVIELHPYLIWENEFHENPYFINYEAYRDNRILEYEVKNWLKNIKKYKKKTKKLERTENEYQELFSEAPVGIFKTTSTGKVISVNKAMAEMLGYSSPKEVVSAYSDLKKELYVDSNIRDEFIEKLKNKAKVENFVYEALKKNGDKIYLSMNAKIDKKIEDKLIIKGFVYDITKRIEYQQELEEKKQELFASNMELTAYNEEIKAMNEELEQSFEEINDLNERFVDMIELVANMEDKTLLDEKEFFAELLENAIEIVPEADYGKICVLNEEGKFNIIGGFGHKFELLKDIKIDRDLMKDLDKVEAYKSENYCIDYNKLPEKQKENLKKALKPIKESLNINIKIENETVAKLTLDIKKDSNENFSDTTQKILKSFANLAASFFAFKRFDRLKTNFTRELISSIIKILEMYDLYTKGHSENVAKIASNIAEKMKFSKKIIKDAYWAGLVHDIGKLLIPVDVLNKKGKLANDEYELIKKHSIYGKKALSDSESLEHIAKYVLYHHERWDGTGYPEGISGNDIPPISQILAVADSFDAMLSKRAYRDPLSLEKAKKEIIENSGTQFSPEVANTFLEMLEENEIEDLKKDNLEIDDDYEQDQEGNKAINKNFEINNSTEKKVKEEMKKNKKLQKKLKEKNILFDNILESIQEGISVLDSDLNIKYTNSTMKGWYDNELPLKGKKCFRAYHDKIKPCKNCPTLKSLESGKVESEVVAGHKDSEIDYIEIFSYPIWDENEENMTGVVEFVRDISDRLKQREKLEMMNFTVNKSNLLIFRVKSDGIIEYVNDTVLDKLGYKREELVGDNTKKIVKAKGNYIERKKFWNRIKESKAITYERKFITKNGNKFPVEITSQYYKYEDKEYEFVFAKDITRRKEQEKKIREQKAYFEQLFNNSTEAIVLLDNNHRVIKTNKKFESLFGFEQSELKNKNLDNFILPENFKDKGKNYTKRVKQGEKIEKESIRKAKSGQKINVHLQGFPIKLANGHIGIYAIYRDITERKEREEKIEYLSYKDQLTNLYNRRFFKEEMNRLDTKRQLPISIIMADLNGLKIINDSYGHEKGDEVLKRTAKILKDSIREEDILARQGGDEFAILLPKTNKKEAQKVLNRIKNKANKTNDEIIPISIALGIATKENIEQNIEKTLKKADDNMYQNKLSESRSSKNNIVQGLLNTLNTKSPETKEHTQRMTNLSKKFGKKLNLSNTELNKLSLLATLHDIGKTNISEDILVKPGNLTAEEWEIMKEHSEKGYKIASASKEFVLVAEEILSHHEHWDGNGYPRGLEGEDIPYLARIISIIDAYDVMTNDRPYSKAISKAEALEEIKDCAGSQFDPELAKEFIKLKKNNK